MNGRWHEDSTNRVKQPREGDAVVLPWQLCVGLALHPHEPAQPPRQLRTRRELLRRATINVHEVHIEPATVSKVGARREVSCRAIILLAVPPIGWRCRVPHLTKVCAAPAVLDD